MLVLGLILSVFAVGFFCWLLFTLAIYALPLFIGVVAAFMAYHHGAGLIGCGLIAILGGFTALFVGQLAFAVAPSPMSRALIAVVFTAPAAVAGYSAACGLAHIGIASTGWCAAIGVIGAIFTGAAAFARLSLIVPRRPATGSDAAHPHAMTAAGP